MEQTILPIHPDSDFQSEKQTWALMNYESLSALLMLHNFFSRVGKATAEKYNLIWDERKHMADQHSRCLNCLNSRNDEGAQGKLHQGEEIGWSQ